ncbi:MAG: DnaJ domain-containing protein [Synergistaceae bacterium]|nr:DnaJ domain-containing protein [Synergistaceae bacterium]
MNAFKDYYFILGIIRTASQEDIEKAYRYSMSVVKTSDFGNAGENAELQQSILSDVNEAYECLRNPAKRRAYDERMKSYTPPPPTPTRVNPGVSTNSKELVELYFNELKKKKSRSFPTLGKFFRAMFFLIFAGASAAIGLNYFQTGKLGLPDLRQNTQGQIQQAAARITTPFSASPSAQPAPTTPANAKNKDRFIRVYDIRYGGVITAQKAVCRKEPEPGAPSAASMANDAIVFVTKECRSENGDIWYFVESSQGAGWVEEGSVKVYK